MCNVILLLIAGLLFLVIMVIPYFIAICIPMLFVRWTYPIFDKILTGSDNKGKK